jgi:hypothetical protein
MSFWVIVDSRNDTGPIVYGLYRTAERAERERANMFPKLANYNGITITTVNIRSAFERH